MHLAKFVALILQNRKQRILRTELKPVGVFVNALKRSLIINDNRRNLPVIDVRLLFNKYQVAVKDMRIYHAVADTAKSKISAYTPIKLSIALNILLSKNRLTASDFSDHGHRPNVRHSLNVFIKQI